MIRIIIISIIAAIVLYDIVKTVWMHRNMQDIISLVGNYCYIKLSKTLNSHQWTEKELNVIEYLVMINTPYERIKDFVRETLDDVIENNKHKWDFNKVYNTIFQDWVNHNFMYRPDYTLFHNDFRDFLNMPQYQKIKDFVKSNKEYLYG